MSDALQAGEITAFSAWEPTSTIALTKYPEDVVIHRYLSSGYLYFTKIFSDKYPEVVRQILAAEIRALRWMQSDIHNLLQASEWAMQAIENLTNQEFILSVEQNANLARDDLLGLIPVPIIPGKTLSQDGPLYSEFEFLKVLGKIPASIEWDRVRNSFNTSIITYVLVNPEKYNFKDFDYDIN